MFLNGAPAAYLVDDDLYAVHTDHLGTPRLLTDNQGQTVWQAIYRPFGEAEITRNTIDFPHRLPGQYVDAETGTHYNHFRDYDPATGRYLSSDPIGLHGGANTYAYAGGNPLAATDVLGLADSLVIGAGPPGLFDIADQAAANGSITGAQREGAIEGMLAVPKPSANSEFVQKLEAVFARAADELRNNPTYTDNRLADFVDTLAQDATTVAGLMILYGALTVAQPPLALLLMAGGSLYAGAEAIGFLGSLFQVGLQASRTDLCDAGGLNALGDQLAQNVYDTGINIASGAVLGAFGGVAHTASLIKLPARTPNRATYQELEEEIAQQISQSAARPDSPIKTELNVAPGAGYTGHVGGSRWHQCRCAAPCAGRCERRRQEDEKQDGWRALGWLSEHRNSVGYRSAA